ncbi:unnamed protein product (macronuclear) [Paramecium tetraurelia]|uniref:Adenylyltransferase and sulfurtransferase MOCS3 homolog n=1 Tax=Paramecium tetraurelia TaxID=5888 RepID=Q6BG38_PARTE|nr:Molybdopterin synthase sulfurylase [Paramecium tetraurelia strain d4-2]XP_001423300.1 uncharacterized protein GSPATT00000337001 [Paramecium tetraurelia]CAH03382.1 Molybdopterin synthase sulfurylase, putative [Paramecium tetraurelia]CAK55902.1 unnamed protein product [Paramecium tetraurelia]|eukprot:XP_001423300.1 hypothetical protein (macronuclear) [Paramecium tetraurelia strain d4-2]
MKEYIEYLQNLLKQNKIEFEQEEDFIQHKVSQINNEFGYEHINRYKRQMILSEIGLTGQKQIHLAKVLIVGAGGIGAPAIYYLAGAGVGTIGLVDGDSVDVSNLHRQIIHNNYRQGMNKCESAKLQINEFNPLVNVITYKHHLSSANAIEIFQNYDVILDATDNPATRYLINDTAIYLNKPLVSGSSVGWEGQITVYGMQGPCYRCLFPQCPKTVQNCNEAGVFGVMPGLIGLIEALQAIKIIIGQQTLSQKMILIDGLRDVYKVVKLRGQQKDCIACQKQIKINDYDYASFAQTICSSSIPYRGGYKEIEWKDFLQIQRSEKVALLDVRPSSQYNIIKLDGFTNLPYSQIDQLQVEEYKDKEIYIMCRRGNNSRLACEYLKDKTPNIYNIIGGIDLYAKLYDPKMPLL